MNLKRFRPALLLLALCSGVAGGSSRMAAQAPAPRPNVAITKIPSMWFSAWPADFNRDGRTDLVAGRPFGFQGNGELVVRLGNGNGTFGAESVVGSVTARPLGVGDFNGDRRTDVLAVTTDNMVIVVPGTGDGTFAGPVAFATALYEDAIAVVADLDADGHRDAVVTQGGGGMDVHRGNGDFSFDPPVPLITGDWPHGAVAADLNGDERLDLVVATRYGFRLEIFTNNGGMLFTAASIPFDRGLFDVTAWDMDGDTDLDLVVAGSEEQIGSGTFINGLVWVLENDGEGSFEVGTGYETLGGAFSIVAGDFNRDDRPDVATANQSLMYDIVCESRDKLGDSVSIFPGLGDGTLGAPASFALRSPNTAPYVNNVNSLNTSDLNGDRETDLILSPGAILLNIPAAANRRPTVSAGPDQATSDNSFLALQGTAADPDSDWLTYRWTDAAGHLLSTVPDGCVREYNDGVPGTYEFTLTVDDGRGGVRSDAMLYTIVDPSEGPLPSGWNSGDVGGVAAAGSSSAEAGVFTITGSGADIWGTADEFQYAYQFTSGNFTLTARVASIENVHRWVKAGIMVRETLGAGSRHASLFATPTTERGLAFQRRTTTNGASVSTAGPAIAPPVWLRVGRVGNTVSAYYRRTDTDAWSLVGRQTFSGLAADIHVGLAVSSHVDGTLATATFDNVFFERLLPWMSLDIGAVGLAGSTAYDGVVLESEGGGADIWGTADAFRFVHRQRSGNFSITARVRSIENTHAWAKAGVMVRDGIAANAKHVMLIVSPGKGVAMQYRAVTGGVTVNAALRPGTAPEWVRLLRNGDTVTGFVSENGTTWVEIGVATVPLPFAPRAGLAVTSHNNAALATGVFDSIAIEP